jgi:WD40 repeat protein
MVLICAALAASSAVFAADFIYVAENNAIEIIDCQSDKIIKTIPAYNDYIMTAAYSPDGKRFYANGYESIYEFDTQTHQLLNTYQFSSHLNKVTVWGFAVSNDGAKLYLGATVVKKKPNVPRLNVLPPQLVVYDMGERRVLRSYDVPSALWAVITIKSDPDSLILVHLDVHKLDLEDGKLEKLMGGLHPEEGEEAKNLAFNGLNESSQNDAIVAAPYFTATGTGYLIIDRNDGTIRTLKGEDPWSIYSTRVSPDQKFLYGVMEDLVKIDIESGKTVKSTPLVRGTSNSVAVTSDNKKIYVGPGGSDIAVYDGATFELLDIIPLSGDGVVMKMLSR